MLNDFHQRLCSYFNLLMLNIKSKDYTVTQCCFKLRHIFHLNIKKAIFKHIKWISGLLTGPNSQMTYNTFNITACSLPWCLDLFQMTLVCVIAVTSPILPFWSVRVSSGSVHDRLYSSTHCTSSRLKQKLFKMQSGLFFFCCALQTRSWHFTHAHTSSGCSPQIGSQTGHLARQLAALFVHAPHAVDKRREHTSRTWTSEPDPCSVRLCHTAAALSSNTEHLTVLPSKILTLKLL